MITTEKRSQQVTRPLRQAGWGRNARLWNNFHLQFRLDGILIREFIIFSYVTCFGWWSSGGNSFIRPNTKPGNVTCKRSWEHRFDKRQLKNNNHPWTFKTENFGGLNVNENSMTTNYSLTTHNRSKATFPIEVIKIATWFFKLPCLDQ